MYRVPFSTNVERIALAAGHKGLEIEWVDVDPDDRSVVEQLSGQSFVPVLETDGLVLADSPAILRCLEERFPEPPLWPATERGRGEADLFVEWFNGVWKRAPNELADAVAPGGDETERLGGIVAAHFDLFESLLEGRDYFLGAFSVADVVAFPFLRYAVDDTPGDSDPFHQVLRDWQSIENHHRLGAWIDRVQARPRG